VRGDGAKADGGASRNRAVPPPNIGRVHSLKDAPKYDRRKTSAPLTLPHRQEHGGIGLGCSSKRHGRRCGLLNPSPHTSAQCLAPTYRRRRRHPRRQELLGQQAAINTHANLHPRRSHPPQSGDMESFSSARDDDKNLVVGHGFSTRRTAPHGVKITQNTPWTFPSEARKPVYKPGSQGKVTPSAAISLEILERIIPTVLIRKSSEAHSSHQLRPSRAQRLRMVSPAGTRAKVFAAAAPRQCLPDAHGHIERRDARR